MRELIFKAKRKGFEQWVEFDLNIEIGNNQQISEFFVYNFVVGSIKQFTGICDINGKKIFEGDTVKWGHIENSRESYYRVAIVEINPDIQFKVIYYINSLTGEKKDGNGHVFDYGSFAYKKTENVFEII